MEARDGSKLTTSGAPNRVVAIGLDGADPTIIETWMDQGQLPVLQSIRANGGWGQLEGIRDFFSGSVWPSFLTGASVANHGFYGFAQLGRQSGQLELMDGSMLGIPPFYARLSNPKKRVAVLDVAKMTPVRGVNGIQIAAWASHSPASPPASSPPELIDEVRHKYGEHPASAIDEDANPDDRYYRRLLKALHDGCQQRQSLYVELLRREQWDLFIAIFSEAHSAGHKLWQFVDPLHPDFDTRAPEDLKQGMLSVHQDLDRALGALREASPPDTTFMVFSMHGMALDYNDAPTQLLPEFMRRFCGIERSQNSERASWRARLYEMARSVAPEWLRNAIKHRMSLMARSRMRLLQFIEMHDAPLWHKMRAFSLPSDEGGFIRINLKGREPCGLVEAGDYDLVCEEIMERLHELRDPNLDCAAVNRVFRVHREHAGPFLDRLPDLVVEWSDRPLTALWSPVYGHLGTMRIHRSGSHRPRGFLLAEGPGIAPGSAIRGRSIDIPATILARMGEPMQPETAGQSLLPVR